MDASNNLFVGDNEFIRKVAPEGTITTITGDGKAGFSGDGGLATAAEIEISDVTTCDFFGTGCDGLAGGMALDSAGNLFLADTYNGRVREIATSGTITTIAGPQSINPPIMEPFSVAFDHSGNLFTVDARRSTVLKIAPDGGATTIAGDGYTSGYSGDGGISTSALLDYPESIATDSSGNIYIADMSNGVVRVLRPTSHSVLISSVVDAASQASAAASPGKIIVIYGSGLGPSQLVQNQAANGKFGLSAGGTAVSFNGIPAVLLYSSATQVAAVTPHSISGATAQVTVSYQGETSAAVTVPVALSAPNIFTLNQSGAGQAAAINTDGTVNSAIHPVTIGGYISLYATGEGQTDLPGIDGQLGGTPAAHPKLAVSVTVDGIPATVQYSGSIQGQVAGLMQINVQIPAGVKPGGYVPVALKVGDRNSSSAVWIAVSN